jgi:hypothetical protein
MENLIDCNYEADMFLMLFEFYNLPREQAINITSYIHILPN